MYIVEAEKVPSDYFDAAYHLVGEAAEIEAAKRNIGSLILSAISSGVIKNEEGYLFLYDLLRRDNEIENRSLPDLHKLLENPQGLKNDRLRTLTATAAVGNLSTRTLFEEWSDLTEFYLEGGDDLSWITKEGFTAYISNASFVADINTDLKLTFGEEGEETSLAKQLDLNAFTFQVELTYNSYGKPTIVDRLGSHITLGTQEEDGTFSPYVTVLSEDHPARVKVN